MLAPRSDLPADPTRVLRFRQVPAAGVFVCARSQSVGVDGGKTISWPVASVFAFARSQGWRGKPHISQDLPASIRATGSASVPGVVGTVLYGRTVISKLFFLIVFRSCERFRLFLFRRASRFTETAGLKPSGLSPFSRTARFYTAEISRNTLRYLGNHILSRQAFSAFLPLGLLTSVTFENSISR